MSTKVETDGASMILAVEFLIYDEASNCQVAPNTFDQADEDDQDYSENESPMQL